jgi:uncharacterized protein (TIGR03084 family)
MTIFDDLEIEEERIDAILHGLDPDGWETPSGAPGWSISDVVLHLAQSEETVVASASGAMRRPMQANSAGGSVDEVMERRVQDERGDHGIILDRWRSARRHALELLRSADPDARLPWVVNAFKPATLATTRLAEHWAHALDITTPLGIEYADTHRLRHVAWLGHRMFPYAFASAGSEPEAVFCELVGPGGEHWLFGPPGAASSISGPAGDFCRVGAQRLDPDRSGLATKGPHGSAALRILRNYA